MVCSGMIHSQDKTLIWAVGGSSGEQSKASGFSVSELVTSKRAPAPGLEFRDSIQVMWVKMGGDNRDWHE